MRPIAIIGASCRFPGANGLREFWELLCAGRNSITTVPKERWDADALAGENPESRVHIATRHGAFIPNIREFDCSFFGISPREAAAMDPQHRLLLETAYEAFEDAGIPMEALAGSQTAVYVGIGPGDYGRMGAQPGEEITAHYVTGNFLSTAVDRLAYFFDLRGPSMAVDTACSSSLVSVHLACQSLESSEAGLALAGGVNALLAPTLSISLAKAGALSPTGQCRSFDADADGYVRGEGAGFVVLKHMEKAVADGDRIYAVIRGTAVRQGGRRNGITAPGGWGQAAVMKAAWEAAEISPAQADYVEAQATGTVLGDAIEVNAISNIFGGRNGRGPCRIGSVKTNIGHLETAAGISSLIKVALMIYHGEFVASLYPQKPNPHVNFPNLGLSALSQAEPWNSSEACGRAAGVSAFGMGGTYAHVCMTDAALVPDTPAQEHQNLSGFVLPISARHPDAVRQIVENLLRLSHDSDTDPLHGICRAAAVRRTHHDYRVAFAGLTPEELIRSIQSWLQQGTQAVKANRKNQLVVLVPATDSDKVPSAALGERVEPKSITERDKPGHWRRLLTHLENWGVRPAEILFYEHNRVIRRTCLDSATQEIEVTQEELTGYRADFLDLTHEGFLNRVPHPVANRKFLIGFNSAESQSLTPLRLICQLYELGYPLSWTDIHPGMVRQFTITAYPWQHQECWLSSLNAGSAPTREVRPQTARPVPAYNGSLRSVLAKISGLAPQEIHPDSSPAELGIDSLLTLELQEDLRRISGVLIPVEALVQVRSVRELELLLQGTTIVPPQGPAPISNRAIEIHEARLDDYADIKSVVTASGLGMKVREEWEHMWTGNPVCRKSPDWPIGWVVRDQGKIVGFLGNIPLSYNFKGREILASGLHSFALKPSHRGLGLLLLNRLLEFAPEVEYFVGSTANLNSSEVLDRIGVNRIPVGDWQNSSFWITNYNGFVRSAISKKGLPDSLAGAGSAALRLYEKVSKMPWPDQKYELKQAQEFDSRFDIFWNELQEEYPDRLLANRSRDHLQWHFNYSLHQDRAWVVTYEQDARIAAYAIFHRQDYREIKLQRLRLVDYQSLPGFEGILTSMLAWGLNRAREQGIHMLEAFGFRPDKQQIIDALAPHHRKLTAWGYYHKITSRTLEAELKDANAWDPSQYDGDCSL